MERMNKRIRELAVQTEAYISEPNDWKMVDFDTSKIDLEKFAELIVQECAELCSTHEMADEPFGVKSYRKGRHFDVMIRRHFGVEE